MKLCYFRAIYVSGVLLMTAAPTCGLSGADIAAPRAATLVNEPPKRLLMTSAAGKGNEEERVQITPLEGEELAAYMAKVGVGKATTRTSAITLSLARAGRDKGSTSRSSALTLNPATARRDKRTMINQRVILYSDELQAFLRDNPQATVDEMLEHLQTVHLPHMNQADVAIALYLAHDVRAWELNNYPFEDAQFAKFLDEGIHPDELQGRLGLLKRQGELYQGDEQGPWTRIHPDNFIHDAEYVDEIVAEYREYYAKKKATSLDNK